MLVASDYLLDFYRYRRFAGPSVSTIPRQLLAVLQQKMSSYRVMKFLKGRKF